jgi:hypothetical protein
MIADFDDLICLVIFLRNYLEQNKIFTFPTANILNIFKFFLRRKKGDRDLEYGTPKH